MWPIRWHLLLHHHVVLTSDIGALAAFTQNFDLSVFYRWLIRRSGQQRGFGDAGVMFSPSWKPLTHVLFVKCHHTGLSQKTSIYHVCLTWFAGWWLLLHFRVQSGHQDFLDHKKRVTAYAWSLLLWPSYVFSTSAFDCMAFCEKPVYFHLVMVTLTVNPRDLVWSGPSRRGSHMASCPSPSNRRSHRTICVLGLITKTPSIHPSIHPRLGHVAAG